MGHKDHKSKAIKSVTCGILTVSDSRSPDEDTSGKTILDILVANGHSPVYLGVVKDDIDEIRSKVEESFLRSDIRALVINGGTGISNKDVTVQALKPLIDKALPGFGEIFRMLSYKEIGSAAMMSRSIAGIVKGMPVFCLPGSTNACKLAMTELIVPELGHLVWEVSR